MFAVPVLQVKPQCECVPKVLPYRSGSDLRGKHLLFPDSILHVLHDYSLWPLMTFIYLDFSFLPKRGKGYRWYHGPKMEALISTTHFHTGWMAWWRSSRKYLYVWCKFCRFCSWSFKQSALSDKSLEHSNVVIIYRCPNIMLYFQEYINEPLLHWKMAVRWIPIKGSNVIFWRTVTLMGSLATSSPLELATSSLNQLWKPYCTIGKLKHRKNCECCPGHYMIVDHYSSI